MTVRISKLFGMDIYTADGDYKGKVFDLVINLEKGKIETVTTEPLKARSKIEAKKIISEKSIPYNRVRAAKDILIVGQTARPDAIQEEEEAPQRPMPTRPYRRF
ncbi:PRC-barrel domain protein [uncultured archaeon]|nr:PRC-barrel domain protein [uncultured archaeon]